MALFLKKYGVADFFKKGLWLLLFPVFFILHGNNEFFGLIPIPVSLGLLGRYLLITLLAFLVSAVLFRDAHRSFLYSFFMMAVFFFFGAFHDLLKEIAPQTFLVSYSFLLPVLGLLWLGWAWILFKHKNGFTRLGRYLVLLLGFLVAFEVITGITKGIRGGERAGLYAHAGIGELNTDRPDCMPVQPDIFFIVFDEYTSSEGLKTYFNYSNHVVDSLLLDAGFYTAREAASNYNMTAFSLASTFNMDYLEMKGQEASLSGKMLLRGEKTLAYNRLTSFLRQNGYETVNLGCFDLEGTTTKYPTYFNYLPAYVIHNQTLAGRIDEDLGWRFRIRHLFSGEPRIPPSYLEKKRVHLERNEYNTEELIRQLKTAGSGIPRFVYTHLMLPHDPFYLDANGNPVSDTLILFNHLDREKAYLDQLTYANTILEKIIREVPVTSGRPRVVIIEGDHGFGYHDRPEYRDREFKNLNAYYFSDKDYSQLYSSVSPVNSFRVVLNKYFCTHLPLLTDSTRYIRIKRGGIR